MNNVNENGHCSMEGRTLLVTGGGGDIGFCTAKRFAKLGVRIALIDLRQESLIKASAELSSMGAKVVTCLCDITSESAVREAIDEIYSELGSIDFLFNNAGYQGEFAPFQNYPVQDFRKVIEINLTGAFLVMHFVVQGMVKARFGRIVNMASRAGTYGPPNMAAYAASKAGLIGLTKTAAKDLAPYGIRVNSIGPALLGPGMMWDRQVALQAAAGSHYFSDDPKQVERQMIAGVPMKRLGNLEEVASVVEFLMSESSSYLTGTHIPIGGGLL